MKSIPKASQAFGRLQASVWNRQAIYEANRIAATKAKRVARKTPALRTSTVDAQALPTCPRCQRTFRARIGLVGHLWTQCTINPAIPTSKSNYAFPPSDSPTLTPGIKSITPTIIETTSQYSSPVTPTTATNTAFAATTFAATAAATVTTTSTTSDGDSLLNCPQCDRIFTSRIGLVVHLQIQRTETGEPAPGAPTDSSGYRFYCPHCPHAFTHSMGLFGRMRIYDSRIHRNVENTDTPCKPSAPAILTTTATPTTMNDIPQPIPISPAHTATASSTHASAWAVTRQCPGPSNMPTLSTHLPSITLTIIETTSQYTSPVTSTTTAAAAATTISDGDSLLNCHQCDQTFTSRIGLVGHLRIHRTEAGIPGSDTQSSRSPPLPSMLPHIYTPHGPIKTHAPSRKPAGRFESRAGNDVMQPDHQLVVVRFRDQRHLRRLIMPLPAKPCVFAPGNLCPMLLINSPLVLPLLTFCIPYAPGYFAAGTARVLALTSRELLTNQTALVN
ncbi:unnamed protein product [Schistocephalus solidus]|uniref:C2H2-type domain-containing protein n=1 Tax=Schistocephalus solidus TaxID=70667 RepID=A0A183THL7_SCHSO|nr:unnamed protein product [Schistocephalus solidus]